MNNIEDYIADNPIIKPEPLKDQGFILNDRKLRNRANLINYKFLDHGDSSYNSEYFSEDKSESISLKELDKVKVKNGKKGKRTSKKKESNTIVDNNINSIKEFLPRNEEDTIIDKDEFEKEENDELVLIDGKIIDMEKIVNLKITNSLLLLALIEICVNAENYGIKLANKSRVFWDEVYSIKQFEIIFKNFKAETLRKYWRIISDIGKLNFVIKTIRTYSSVIDNENAKLLTVIYSIQDYIKGRSKKFNVILKNYTKPSSEGNNLKKKRRYTDNLENDILEMETRIKMSKLEHEAKLDVIEEHQDKEVKEASKKNIIVMNSNQSSKISFISETEYDFFKKIDEILDFLIEQFNELSRNQILEALYLNTFNLEKTYSFLKKPDDTIIFTDYDDYILRYLKNTEVYNKLVELKGEEYIVEREKFILK